MDGSQNGPGVSLFQGSDNFQLNPDVQREEEEEAAADQRRRDQELHNLLTNAFDDLYDDDDDDDDDQSTISSSHLLGSVHQDGDDDDDDSENNFPNLATGRFTSVLFGRRERREEENHYISEAINPISQQINEHTSPNMNSSLPGETTNRHEEYMNMRNLAESRDHAVEDIGGGGDPSVSTMHYQHCYRNSPGSYMDVPEQDANEQYRQAPYNSMEQLQVLYEVRVREVHRLTQQLEQQHQEAAQEKDQLLRRVALREAEKERSQMLYKQAQSLLVEHKEKITELEKQVEVLQATVAIHEKSKSELTHQLEVSQASVLDLHNKISLLERGNLNNTNKHMDSFLRNVQAAHDKELKRLEIQLESVAAKFSKKEHDLEELQKHTKELIRQHEAHLVEKGETINQLSRSLEESQRQCQQLMSSSVGEEVIKLKVQLETAVKEKESLQSKQQEFLKELEAVRSDLKQYEAVAQMGLFHPNEPVDKSDSMIQLGIQNHNKQTGPAECTPLSDLNAKLRDELQRALISQKLKREEIVRLKAQLTSQGESIAALQKQEAVYLVEVEKLKAEYIELIEELNNQREIAKKALAQRQKSEEVERALKKLESEAAAHAELEAALASAREQCDLQTKLNEKLRIEMEELQKTLDEDKKRAIDQYSEEYLHLHDQAVARVRQERDREHEAIVTGLRVELEDAQKESDRVKQLYIEVCGSKEELLSQLQQERKASQELANQLKKLETEMKAYDETEKIRARNHEAAMFKLEKEKVKLETEWKNFGEVQALQKELEAEKVRVKKLEAHYKAAIEQTQAEKEKLEEEQRLLAEVRELRKELENEKTKAKEAKALLKMQAEKEFETEQHAISEAKALKMNLDAERCKIEQLKLEHEATVQKLMSEKEKSIKEVEEKARQLYTIRVTEEIEKAKNEALTELEKDWNSKLEEQNNQKVKQLKAECSHLNKEMQLLIEKHAEATGILKAELERQKQQFIELESLQAKQKQQLHAKEIKQSKTPVTQNSGLSPIPINDTDSEKVRRELTRAFTEQLSALQTKHQLVLEETREKVKDETVRFFAEQVRQAENKHRTDLQRVEQAYKESMISLRKTLMEERAKMQMALSEKEKTLMEEHTKLLKLQETLAGERARDNGYWKARAEALANHLEESKQKMDEATKNSEMLRTKYRTAKKTAHNYKAYVEAKEKHLNSEWHRINTGFQQALEQVQNRLESLLKSDGSVNNAKVIQCTEQIKQLRKKM